jgi:perosamine synthetase
MELNKTYIYDRATISDALKALDINGLGVVFIVNDQIKILGLLTDGDIRRALLKGISIEEGALPIMNTKFKSFHYKIIYQEISNAIDNKYKVIPLVDDQGKLVDYATSKRITNIPIAIPSIGDEELNNVIDCVKSGWISSQGSYVVDFEKEFSRLHENRFALSVSNGTVALHLALVALGIGKGDEVIVPDLTFAASINSIIHSGATPVLIDVDRKTWNIDVQKISSLITHKTKAILPVHLYGNPCQMDDIVSLANEFGLKIIEDCAESLGSLYNNKPLGIYGDAATYSFFGNKTITTGEGGMILFKNEEIYQEAKILRDHGMSKEKRYWHDVVGYNYRLTNLQASIGVAQLVKLDSFVKRKIDIANEYRFFFSQYDFFEAQNELKNSKSSYWLFSILLNDNAPFKKKEFIDALKLNGIDTRPVFYPLHLMPVYKDYSKKRLINSIELSAQGISLPSYVGISDKEIQYIFMTVKNLINV